MGCLKYREKVEKFKEMTFLENRRPEIKWKNREELGAYLEMFGGRLKEDMRRRRGHLVSLLQDKHGTDPRLVAEVPMDFAEKVLAMGGFP